MRGLHKSKRVSWASDLDLCQIRLFLSEESPSQVGLNSQDHLQAKTSLLLPPGGTSSDDFLPPGFEGTQASTHFEVDLSQIPVSRWTTPCKIILNLAWQVVAGEESKEVEDQCQREMRVLEAIYPRPSSIPPNPSVSADVEASQCIDSQTTLIPITPMEDEDATTDSISQSNSFELPPVIPNGPNPHTSVQLAHGSLSDALTSVMKNNEHGNLIDPELFNNILKNPEVIEKLVRDYGASNSLQSANNPGSSSVTFSHPSLSSHQVEASAPTSVTFSSPNYPSSGGNQVGPVSTQWLPRPPMSQATISSASDVSLPKDVNYYKSLIQQHGEERQETHPYTANRQIQRPMVNHETPQHNSRSRETKSKIMKPCIFFNSSRGCRNGANCAYQHDVTFQSRGSAVPSVQSSKRMKMDSEISS
ncbi:hypothetical protein HN51_052045 [Arachis hypogaea]|uniref:C3H1-type domain-containing protein n=1 Tax=Arachis hypogaea TaxID=3818 RepID=A0A445CCB1_ARAHY|nr:zinc finger CCCH domain-containing protein 6 [Arachis ipaensis]XP_029150361.1 zinc finger CCCH domain-containing protein 6 [Arachis hypogaea]QHN93312.1 Zinc finger CCCH domain-containing protein [Arachis hypogaea]RYR48580.1 hypothetical protein Ahy_A07g034615 [Arachis hypogaea]